MKYIFTTISYGEKYHELTLGLAQDLAKIRKQLLIYTENPSYFKKLDNVIVQAYTPLPENKGRISGYDKDRLASGVLEISECMWYIDSDWRLKSDASETHLLDEIEIEPGLTSAQGPMGKIHSDGYPKACVEWARERYGISKPRHYGEACYMIKGGDGVEEYLRVLLEFGKMSDAVEIARDIPRFISKSSGVSFGYAQQAAGLTRNSNRPIRRAFYSNFIHSLVTTTGKIK